MLYAGAHAGLGSPLGRGRTLAAAVARQATPARTGDERRGRGLRAAWDRLGTAWVAADAMFSPRVLGV